MKKSWFKMAVKDDTAELEIFDEIDSFWGIGPKEFKASLDSVKGAKTIKLLVNSPGGSVFDGMAIYNMLSQHRDRLDIEVVGLAASIASIIALAGRSLTMAEGSYFMIHNPLTVMVGNAEELRKTAALLDKMKEDFLNIYESVSVMPRDEIAKAMDDETWLTAGEAVDAGFATHTKDYGEIAATVKPKGVAEGFKHLPEGVKIIDEKITNPRELERLLRDAGVSRKQAVAIVAAAKDPEAQSDSVAVPQSDSAKPLITPAMLIQDLELNYKE
jgi:ATP-dependent Clp protease, protease subunit